jgi:hypothetical protein
MHRHRWKIIEFIEHPSAMEQLHAAGGHRFEADDMVAMFQRDVIITKECKVCGTQEAERV